MLLNNLIVKVFNTIVDSISVIHWDEVYTFSTILVVGIFLRFLLDLDLAKSFVKYFSWIPTRTTFRSDPTRIAGQWNQVWDFNENSTDSTYSEEKTRVGHPVIKQFWKYCYAEFFSGKKRFYIFGKIDGEFVSGHWKDCNDKNGHFGTFQLKIIDSSRMEGRWIGHSKRSSKINGDFWTWDKME